jgi:hypothetical protein
VLFDYLDDFCTIYLDDILIYFDNVLEHEYYVKLVLQRLREAGLQVDIKKAEFHDTAHPGKTKTFQLIAPRYYWKGLRVDVDRYIANCHECRRASVP